MVLLTINDLIILHGKAIEAHGGEQGLLADGLSKLNYVIFSQEPIFGHDPYPNIFLKCANIFFLLNKDHAFVDGNKRTALLAALTFLGKNGYEFIGDEKLTEYFTLEVAGVNTHAPGFDKNDYIQYIATWLARNSKKIIAVKIGKRTKFKIAPWSKKL